MTAASPGRSSTPARNRSNAAAAIPAPPQEPPGRQPPLDRRRVRVPGELGHVRRPDDHRPRPPGGGELHVERRPGQPTAGREPRVPGGEQPEHVVRLVGDQLPRAPGDVQLDLPEGHPLQLGDVGAGEGGRAVSAERVEGVQVGPRERAREPVQVAAERRPVQLLRPLERGVHSELAEPRVEDDHVVPEGPVGDARRLGPGRGGRRLLPLERLAVPDQVPQSVVPVEGEGPGGPPPTVALEPGVQFGLEVGRAAEVEARRGGRVGVVVLERPGAGEVLLGVGPLESVGGVEPHLDGDVGRGEVGGRAGVRSAAGPRSRSISAAAARRACIPSGVAMPST